MLIGLRKHWAKKAQSTVEYGILIGVIVAAAVAMQTYIKRSLQAKQKDAATLLTSVSGTLDAGPTLGTTSQYEPYYLARHQEQQVANDTLTKRVNAGGEALTDKETTSTTGSAMIYRYDQP